MANVLTKGLFKPKHEKCISEIGLGNLCGESPKQFNNVGEVLEHTKPLYRCTLIHHRNQPSSNTQQFDRKTAFNKLLKQSNVDIHGVYVFLADANGFFVNCFTLDCSKIYNDSDKLILFFVGSRNSHNNIFSAKMEKVTGDASLCSPKVGSVASLVRRINSELKSKSNAPSDRCRKTSIDACPVIVDCHANADRSSCPVRLLMAIT
ncbi:hypothetical protein T06_12381 [Trichinella sp. T6]|nr:hypothetical protein T06_12381 [Trichinella sp. T6]